MIKYILLFLLFPILSFSQERVSDIKTNGITSYTEFKNKIGFAQIDSQQYVLKEHHHLFIYKINQDSLILLDSILNRTYPLYSLPQLFSNPSGFYILDGIYYRFTYSSLQIIDIKTVSIIDEYTIHINDFPKFTPLKISNERLCFKAFINNTWKYYHYNFFDLTIEQYEFLSNRTNIYFLNDKIFSVQDSTKLWAFDTKSKKDSLVYENANKFKHILFSKKDSTYVIIDKYGNILKFDFEAKLTRIFCLRPKIYYATDVYIDGDMCITVNLNSTQNNFVKNEINFYNLQSCNLEYTFTTDFIENYADQFHLVQSENKINDLLVLGFFGTNPNPNSSISKSLYYFIDLAHQKFTKAPELSKIHDQTLLILGNNLICSASNYYQYDYSNYILIYNFDDFQVKKVEPNNFVKNNFLTIGYANENNLYVSTCIYNELPKLWKWSNFGSFTYLASIDLFENLGLIDVTKIIPQEDRIYFSFVKGLYSVDEISSPEVPILYNPFVYENYDAERKQTSYDHFIGLRDTLDNSQRIISLNTRTHQLDTFIQSNFNNFRFLASAGPYFIYRNIQSPFQLHYVDIRNNTKFSYPINYPVSGSDFFIGKSKTLILDRTPDGQYYNGPLQLDYENGSIQGTNYSIFSGSMPFLGPDNSFFFVSTNSSEKTVSIVELNKSGDVTTIFEGSGIFNKIYGYKGSEDNSFSAFWIKLDSENCMLIIHGNGNTQFHTVPYRHYNYFINPIISYHNDNFIVRFYNGTRYEYWVYDIGGHPFQLLETHLYLLKAHFVGENLNLLLTDNQYEMQYIIYDGMHHNLLENFTIFFECADVDIDEPTYLKQGYYITSFTCENDDEPWVLDINAKKFFKLADINQGIKSSSPDHFTVFKNYVYFTARSEEKQRQWYRIELNLLSTFEEPIPNPASIHIYPNPTSQRLQFQDDYQDVHVFSTDGKLMSSLPNFKKGESIDVSTWQDSTYFIQAMSSSGEIHTGKFIKITGK